MLRRLNLFLFAVLAAMLLLLLLLRVNHSRPNYQIILGDDMTYSPAYTAYAPNPTFADGRTFQQSVSGTLARGEQRYNFAPTPDDAIRAGEELINPFPLSSAEMEMSADRGAIIFQTKCTSCHGGDGAGNGPVANRGFPPPPSLLNGKSREMKDGQLFHILTYGQNSMPSFADQLPPERRWELINFIRRIQRTQPAGSSAAAEPEVSTQPVAAEQEQVLP